MKQKTQRGGMCQETAVSRAALTQSFKQRGQETKHCLLSRLQGVGEGLKQRNKGVRDGLQEGHPLSVCAVMWDGEDGGYGRPGKEKQLSMR